MFAYMSDEEGQRILYLIKSHSKKNGNNDPSGLISCLRESYLSDNFNIKINDPDLNYVEEIFFSVNQHALVGYGGH